jgi:cyclase
MLRTRVIPCLLLRNRGLVKTVRFKDPTYLGDPINAVKIFNDKEVDELIFLDIKATAEKREPPFKLISEIASECFMPFCYGGGIKSLKDIQSILNLGVEKVSVNSYAAENPHFVRAAADLVGRQSIVVSLDVKKHLSGQYEVFSRGGKKPTGLNPVQFAIEMEKMGAGELLLNSIDRDGTMAGYDLELIKSVTESVSIPVVACGGAGKLEDFSDAVREGGASAVAAGSLFVFQGRLRGVLINYPSPNDLQKTLSLT